MLAIFCFSSSSASGFGNRLFPPPDRSQACARSGRIFCNGKLKKNPLPVEIPVLQRACAGGEPGIRVARKRRRVDISGGKKKTQRGFFLVARNYGAVPVLPTNFEQPLFFLLLHSLSSPSPTLSSLAAFDSSLLALVALKASVGGNQKIYTTITTSL